MTRSANARRAAALALMVASGFAGLGYQIVWTQQCSLWLGHESAAVLAVVSAFFGGLALGGLALGERVENSAEPLRWYVACELVIALWSQLLVVLWSPFSSGVQHALGVSPSPLWQWVVAFFGTFSLLLPATAAMGATLPAMERLTAQLASTGATSERSISTLYAANTLGAVVGVLGASFWLVPSLGLSWTAAICAGLNLACAGLALNLFPKVDTPAPRRVETEPKATNGALWRLGLTGLLGIGYEVLVVRVLSQVTENTVYTFAVLLAVYLIGTAVGAAAYRRWLEGRDAGEQVGDALLAALSVACLLGAGSLWGADAARRALADTLDASVSGAIAIEATLAALAFGLPTLLMGALFSHLTRQALVSGVSFGRATGLNVLAAAAAPAVVGVLAVPKLGAKFSLLLVSCGYLMALRRPTWRTPQALLPAGAAIAVAVFAPELRFVELPEGGRVVDYREGVMAAVSVVEDAGGTLRLRINNRQQEGSSSTRHVDARQAWLPLLLHPTPRSALFLGLGTGVTAWSASLDPSLQLKTVELLPEVIEVSSHFTPIAAEAEPERIRVLQADARRYVKVSDRHYDVIVADNFHPARSGSGSLYTVEHFQAVRERLAPGGLFCQWLPLHQLDLTTLRSIVRSWSTAFPQGAALLASNSLETPVLGLIARADSQPFEARAVKTRVSLPALSGALKGLGLEDEFAVLGSFVAGPQALSRFAVEAGLNTDDRPIVAYRAPRITYAPDSRPRDRLLTLLEHFGEDASEPSLGDPELQRRVAAYRAARGRYLESGRDVRPAQRVEDMLAQVQAPLLQVLRTSPDFRPAYDPLLGMAGALGRSNVSAARALLAELARLVPARREASALLAELSTPPARSELDAAP